MAHLYATFADAAQAEKAAGALLDYGVRKDDITLVAHEDHGLSRQYAGIRQTDLNATMRDDTRGFGDRLPQAGDRVAGAVAGGIGADAAAANYQIETHAAHSSELLAASTTSEYGTLLANTAYGTTENRNDADPMDEDDSTLYARTQSSTDVAAKEGLSTTTPEDAGAGAVKGTEIGLGVGILAGLASLLVPGVGLVLGGGALASAIGAAALTAGAGAVAGGVTGYLKEQGVPGEAITHYQSSMENGGAVLSLNVPSGDVDQTAAEQVLAKYGAADVNAY